MAVQRNDLEPNDLVQIAPDHDGVFGGCFMVVTEIKDWGVQGYVPSPGKGLAYYRVPYEAIELAGKSRWAVSNASEDDDG